MVSKGRATLTTNKYGRTIGTRLKEEELTKLHEILQANGLRKIGELLRAIIRGEIIIARQQNAKIVTKLQQTDL